MSELHPQPKYYADTLTEHVDPRAEDETFDAIVAGLEETLSASASETTADLAQEVDLDGVLYELCANFEDSEKARLGNQPLPETYLEDLYRTELTFAHTTLTKLAALNNNPALERIVVLFDLDRTTVALSEDSKDPFADYGYITRPGMGYLVQKMYEIVGEDRLTLGVLSDRRQETDPKFPEQPNLVQRVTLEHFPDIPIDPNFVLSSTDGPIAQSLPDYAGKKRRWGLPQPEEYQLETDQFNFIGDIVCAEALLDPTMEYHPKAANVAQLLSENPTYGVLWCDDMDTTLLIGSERAKAVHVGIDTDMQPLLADDVVRYPI